MGTPRNEVIGGWPAGNPDDSSWVARSGSRTARGSRISAPSSPRPSGQWWIRLISSSVTPTGMNSASRPPSPITPIAPYCASTSDTADSTMPRSTTSMSRFMPIATTESNKAFTRFRVATTAWSLTCSSASNSSRPRLGKTDLVVPDSTNLLRYRRDNPNRVRSYGDPAGQVAQPSPRPFKLVFGKLDERPAAGMTKLAAHDRTRALQLALGCLWLLDALLQIQSFMLGQGFAAMLTATAAGNPPVMAVPIMWTARVVGHHPAAADE